MRKLVTVRTVSDLIPIEGADFIEVAQVDGWQCIVKKGEFEVGDKGLYFEIDSALPEDDERYKFLHKNSLKHFCGKQVVRIKTMKMKGQVSQGLLLPLDKFPEVDSSADEDTDYSEVLGVVKYEKEVNSPNAAGTFPWYIPKTDQERIQNEFKRLNKMLEDDEFNSSYVMTLKMDGSSSTVAYVGDEKYISDKIPVDENGGQLVVCSRNNVLKLYEEEVDSNKWHKGVQNCDLDLITKTIYKQTGRNLAFQGELVGPGIQGNHEGFTEYQVHVFAIFDIDNQVYLNYSQFELLCRNAEAISSKFRRIPDFGLMLED